MLIERGHLAPLEFGTIYLKFPTNINPEIIMFYDTNPYSRVLFDDEWYYVTTNARVIIENDYTEHLQYMCEPTENHDIRTTAKIICSRSIGNEITRHRAFSFVQESTRYCNYSKNKFGSEITFVIPHWMNLAEGTYSKPYYSVLDDIYYIMYNNSRFPFDEDGLSRKYITFLQSLGDAEFNYFHLLNAEGLTPQDAREILPLNLKTEITMCGYLSDWQHFLSLRCAKDAHPDMQIIANKLKDLLCL